MSLATLYCRPLDSTFTEKNMLPKGVPSIRQFVNVTHVSAVPDF